MGAFRYVLAAKSAGESVDLWQFVRSERQVVDWSREYPNYHHTWKDGHHPHATAQDGFDAAPVHPFLRAAVKSADPQGFGKHHPEGWPSRWRDIVDFLPLGGTSIIFPSDFDRSRRPAARRITMRQSVDLQHDQGVQATHFLGWPTSATRDYIDRIERLDGTVDVVVIDRWQPWSFIQVSKGST